jgi:L-serine deaminase
MKESISNAVEAVRDTKVAQIAGKVWDEMQPAFEAGAHEAASALFRGDAFVMYPQAKNENSITTMAGLKAAAHEMSQEMENGRDDRNGPEQDRSNER